MQHAEFSPHDGADRSVSLGVLEVVALCDGVLILVRGFGLVFGRLSGTNAALLSCLSPFFYSRPVSWRGATPRSRTASGRGPRWR